MDAFCTLGAAENKIVILCTVKFLTETAHPCDEKFFHNKQVANIVYACQKIRIKVRFEMRIKQSSSVHIQLVLIGVDHICLRIFIDGFRALKESVRSHSVIVIRKNNEITGCHIHGCVGVSCDTEVFSQHFIADPGIRLCIFL